MVLSETCCNRQLVVDESLAPLQSPRAHRVAQRVSRRLDVPVDVVMACTSVCSIGQFHLYKKCKFYLFFKLEHEEICIIDLEI